MNTKASPSRSFGPNLIYFPLSGIYKAIILLNINSDTYNIFLLRMGVGLNETDGQELEYKSIPIIILSPATCSVNLNIMVCMSSFCAHIL